MVTSSLSAGGVTRVQGLSTYVLGSVYAENVNAASWSMRLAGGVALVVTACGGVEVRPAPAPAETRSAAVQASLTAGTDVWVKVAVATLWTSPRAPRPVDAKATSKPVDMRGWLSAMPTSVRLGLVGRVETQALYGDRLVVTAVRGRWLHVVAPGQPSHRDARGYPGWVPARQVTTRTPVAATKVATVTRLTTWLRTSTGSRALQVSFGTRLPVLRMSTLGVVVATPTDHRLIVQPADVTVRAPGAASLPRTAASVMASARRFLGRTYLWGGRSGFAVDCSGLTSLVYAVHGVVIPRDADDQARAGSAVDVTDLHGSDLVFFRSGGTVTHVGLYAGAGRMLHAPHTGTVVQVGSLGHPALARRVL